MVWLVILAALMIPMAVVVLDSPVVRSWADRRHGGGGNPGELPADVKELAKRLQTLEAELEAQQSQIAQLTETQVFLTKLLEQAEPRRLPKAE